MILTVVDHASNHVPPEIDLGIDAALLETHIAWDIGAAALARALGHPLHLAEVSRLVVDFNREDHSDSLIPASSGGHAIPGNRQAAREDRLRYWRDYHDGLALRIARARPSMLLSLHSFTPVDDWSDAPQPRPWEVGVLYNADDRAARLALPRLAAAGIVTGDQQPYSGKLLNATMNRHGEGNGIPYLGLEVRQDLIDTEAGVARWAAMLAPVIETVHSKL